MWTETISIIDSISTNAAYNISTNFMSIVSTSSDYKNVRYKTELLCFSHVFIRDHIILLFMFAIILYNYTKHGPVQKKTHYQYKNGKK